MCFTFICKKCTDDKNRNPKCRTKLTWGGCGMHLHVIREAVPAEERCICRSWYNQ